MKRLIVPLTVGIVCSLATLIATRAEGPASKTLKPCVAITGADSHVTKTRYQRVTSADEWRRVLQEHMGEEPTGKYGLFHDPLALPVVIDFDNYMVIAIFQGNGVNNAGLSAVSLVEEDSRIVFRFCNKGYQTIGEAAKVTVYGFFVVPRSTKPIVLEEDDHQYIGDPPVWKERITFPKL